GAPTAPSEESTSGTAHASEQWSDNTSGESSRAITSSSTVMGLLTCPEMQNSFVPWLFFRPKLANHEPPRRRMVGDTATVSTLVTVVGQPNTPTLAGNGGFKRGLPCRPSSDSISAVSSPQMYAPAPRCRYTSKS